MKAYKLTDENGQTRNGMQWGEGVTHSATGQKSKLCSDGWIHFYADPVLAVLMNPEHANFNNPQLWECETSGDELHEPLKSGCKTLTTTKRIDLPTISIHQKIAFGILCAKKVCKQAEWLLWTDNWLSNKDRSTAAAIAASDAASAAYATAAATAYAAASAAAYAYATAAASAASASDTAAATASASASASDSINFVELAHEALTYK